MQSLIHSRMKLVSSLASIHSAVITRCVIVGSPVTHCVAWWYAPKVLTEVLYVMKFNVYTQRRLRSASRHIGVEARVLCAPDETSELRRIIVNGSPPWR